ncbi:unnamed protein product, partial [Mesorhabditis spiculigera]
MGQRPSKKGNDELVDYLVKSGSGIKFKSVERAFRLVDRGRFVPEEDRAQAYRDAPYGPGPLREPPAIIGPAEANVDPAPAPEPADGAIHISAPCIYAGALTKLNIQQGQSFLNIGSGTGYLNTIAGFLIGNGGVNHGIESVDAIVEYAYKCLDDTLSRPEVNCFDFCVPRFVCGNVFRLPDELDQLYDRIYIGAAVDEESLRKLGRLLKIGGIAVAPLRGDMICYRRVEVDKFEQGRYAHVVFSTLREAQENDPVVEFPCREVSTLCSKARVVIRHALIQEAQKAFPVKMLVKVTDEKEQGERDAAEHLFDPARQREEVQPPAVAGLEDDHEEQELDALEQVLMRDVFGQHRDEMANQLRQFERDEGLLGLPLLPRIPRPNGAADFRVVRARRLLEDQANALGRVQLYWQRTREREREFGVRLRDVFEPAARDEEPEAAPDVPPNDIPMEDGLAAEMPHAEEAAPERAEEAEPARVEDAEPERVEELVGLVYVGPPPPQPAASTRDQAVGPDEEVQTSDTDSTFDSDESDSDDEAVAHFGPRLDQPASDGNKRRANDAKRFRAKKRRMNRQAQSDTMQQCSERFIQLLQQQICSERVKAYIRYGVPLSKMGLKHDEN